MPLESSNLSQLEALCKASGEQLRVLDKADERRGVKARGTSDGTMRPKLQRLLKESDERLRVLRAVHRRVINRFHSFLLFLGYSRSMVRDTRPEDFCKTISDFSLEFRATRQTILHQREKEKEREIKGTGSSTPVGQRRSQTLTQDCEEQYKLEEILKTAETLYRLDVTLPRNRRRKTDGQVFIIKHVTAASTLLHQGPQSFILLIPIFNLLPVIKLVSMSENHSGSNLSQLEALCKASGEQLWVLDKADERRGVKARGTSDGTMRPKLQRLLKESDERLRVLRAVHRRVINRFHSFLLFLGYSRSMVRDTRPEDFCKTISDFSLEFRATRQTILHQREKEKERETKGTGSSTPVGQRRSQTLTQDCEEQYKLEEILKTAETLYRLDVTLPRNRRRKTDGQGFHLI
uniref:FH2 domain-containing protein n=1 Tax=Knipowitschia caucasica TaxID=637954 RepID=A0AAV2KMJ2_KNICA